MVESECIGGMTGARVVRGRHLAACADPATCRGCLPCTLSHCQVCRRAHAIYTCASCLAMARTNLRLAVGLAGRLVDEALEGRRALVNGDGIPGGDALVYAMPGADAHGYRAQLASRQAAGLSLEHVLEEYSTDPRPPLAVLTWLADDWHRTRTGKPLPIAATLPLVGAYLDRALADMARGYGFALTHRLLARTVRDLEQVLYDGDRLEVSRVPCWECGTRLVKVYAATAREDHWRCPACREIYDRGRFDRAKHDHLASRGAERYVTVSDAAAAIGRSVRTVRQWVRDERAASVRDEVSGRVVVWWPDVRRLHASAQRRAERRREEGQRV